MAENEYAFVGNGSRVTAQVDASETVLDVITRVCPMIGFDAKTAAFVFRNSRLDEGACFTKVVVRGAPTIVVGTVTTEDNIDFDFDIEDQEECEDPSPHVINEMMESLDELGQFPVDLRLRALRVAAFDVARAAEFLLNGNVPAEATSIVFEEMEDSKSAVIRRLFNETKVDTALLIQYYEACECDEQATLDLLKGMRTC